MRARAVGIPESEFRGERGGERGTPVGDMKNKSPLTDSFREVVVTVGWWVVGWLLSDIVSGIFYLLILLFYFGE